MGECCVCWFSGLLGLLLLSSQVVLLIFKILGKSLLFCWIGGFMLHLLDDTKSVSVAAAWKKKLGTCFFWFSGGSQSGEI